MIVAPSCTRLCSWYWLVKRCRWLGFLSISSHTHSMAYTRTDKVLYHLRVFLRLRRLIGPLSWKEMNCNAVSMTEFLNVPVVPINCSACAGPQCHENCSRPCSWAQWWPSGSDGDDTDSSVHLGTSTLGSFVTTWSHALLYWSLLYCDSQLYCGCFSPEWLILA